jgi:hypothetical protein
MKKIRRFLSILAVKLAHCIVDYLFFSSITVMSCSEREMLNLIDGDLGYLVRMMKE